ncbi:taurine dioxygenase [Altererythrobacter xiamenensis]|uniref:Taurine dioxygenase n=2 Tax=Altererythrobacter xiamenensis TaxID=1316679 RepID=A0A1Y6FNG3_9SPHN|nr:taurine dioxygenase [Altererythrobacter xiamenensis]
MPEQSTLSMASYASHIESVMAHSLSPDSTPIAPVDPSRTAIIEACGGEILPLDPIGAEVRGIDLAAPKPPPTEVIEALEAEMASRGFLVFKSDEPLHVDDFLRASCWWGGRELHSTHGVHPATPGGNRHIFRLSNDRRHGIPGVGPQWHNDGSFLAETFSHSGYHIVRPAEHGGGTHFAHLGAAYDALSAREKDFWSRLSSVNSNSGVVHPLVHRHEVSGQNCVWLHLGMTGAVIEKIAEAEDAFRLLGANEMRDLCVRYNQLLTEGLERGYAIAFEYEQNDCVFIDNLAVAHRAAPEAHASVEQQGLRIMHRSTVRGTHPLAPLDGLPQFVDIHGPSPFPSDGVWQGGGIGFRWDEAVPMQN